jgi:filamentous hemagglutinin
VLSAGNGVPLVNIQTPSAAGVSRNTCERQAIGQAEAITNNGTLIAVAGNDLNILDAVVSNTGDTALIAGHDLNLGTVTKSNAANPQFDSKGGYRGIWSATSTPQVGSQIHGQGNLTLMAGNDLTAIASQMTTGGDATLSAGNNLTLASAANTSAACTSARAP